jgi:nitric oxide reductase subunit B
VVVAGGTMLGIPIGVSGILSETNTRWFGLQGWEFLQIGRLYHVILFASFCTWLVICVRGLWPALRQRQSWSLPNWMVYSIAGIIFMFTASFVAQPDTNFVIADFWRWCTVHMWVEAFFELFTTIIVAYFLYLMGFVSHLVASRVVYLGAVLFLGSGLIGISHNFYWNAKSIESIALGGVPVPRRRKFLELRRRRRNGIHAESTHRELLPARHVPDGEPRPRGLVWRVR